MQETDCFALLDDSAADPDERASRLYTGLAGTLDCRSEAELDAVLGAMQDALRQGRHAVGLFGYELGRGLNGIDRAAGGREPAAAPREPAAAPRGPAAAPLAQVLLFDACRQLSGPEVEDWLAAREGADEPAGIAGLRASVGERDFHEAIGRIRAYLEAGHTYQVNYTYRLRFEAYGTPAGLYRRLRRRQRVPYGALIALPDGASVLSLSPELFLRHSGGELLARPMKGTLAAAGDPGVDAQRMQALALDPKNRAENLMIVDLLRNDLGRVAEVGSVRVPELFAVERFGDVLQMSSTVRARLREGAGLAELFGAVYPCGSITGAPKRRTMQIIEEIEAGPRGLYTGAIGWFEAPASGAAVPMSATPAAPATPATVGDFCLSVPIRTLVLQPPRPDGLRAGELGVGAGIVHDSDPAAELAECRLKAGFLTGLPQSFELLETLRVDAGGRCPLLPAHLRRLAASAAWFGFRFDERRVRDELARACRALPGRGPWRVRLALRQDGACAAQGAPLPALAGPVRLLLAAAPIGMAPPFLRHKTTLREPYDAAWRAAEAQGAFDMLFFNARGELTEGARSNVLVRLDGRWFTPPVEAGLLPGVMRAALMADPAWDVTERTIGRRELHGAERVVVCNALRGPLEAVIAGDPAWPGANDS